MLHILGLIVWIALPVLAALQLWRKNLPRVGPLAAVLGIAIILGAAALLSLNRAQANDHLALLNIGFLYIAISGAAFISYGNAKPGQRWLFSLGFWAAHLGIGALLALGFDGSLLPPLTQTDLPAALGSLSLLYTTSTVLTLSGLFIMALLAILCLVKVISGKNQAV